MIMTDKLITRESQKLTFLFNSMGSVIKKLKEGMTSQKISFDKFDIA